MFAFVLLVLLNGRTGPVYVNFWVYHRHVRLFVLVFLYFLHIPLIKFREELRVALLDNF